jgi:hypothetical protein
MIGECPVPCSYAGGIIDIIELGVSGFHFRTGSFFDLAEKLSLVLSDERLRRCMSLNSSKISKNV